jgi:phosphoribosylformylglycinamidine synthase
MMSNLRELIPGAAHWPHFVRNQSEQFEARLAMVEVLESPSLFFNGMAGSKMPIAVAHGEGFAEFSAKHTVNDLLASKLVTMRFIDYASAPTIVYPYNPNGSPQGITGLTSTDGRFSIMMPHPERVIRNVQNTWQRCGDSEDSAWIRMFRNARRHIN